MTTRDQQDEYADGGGVHGLAGLSREECIVRHAVNRLRNAARIRARYWTSRFPLAEMLNRSDRHCWADLVPWALGWDKFRDLPDRLNGSESCRLDAAKTGSCYCAKFATPEFVAEARANGAPLNGKGHVVQAANEGGAA